MRITLLTTLFVLAVGCSAPWRAGSQVRQPSPPDNPEAQARAAEAMKGLRNKLLTSKPEEVGLSGEDAEAKVWGVLMDVGLPAGVATVVSIRDGTASLYTNTGGGVLGGYAARPQARAFVAAAAERLPQMSPTESFPYPEAGRVKFYVLTREGVYTAEADAQELSEGRHKLSPLYRSADDVLTQLRLASEKQKQ